MELTIENVSKTYPNGVRALNDVNLHIKSGMFGLLGPNGAGKSTLMRTIAALQDPDEGSIVFEDIDVLRDKQGVREVLGYLPQEFGLYPKVTAVDFLDHLAVMKGVTNGKERKRVVESLLNQTNLWDVRKKKLGSFSGGMKQRFGIAQALIGNPKLIIVDEPTAGLDPTERYRFHNLLSEIGENVVVILSTHIVDDVSDLCHDMAIIHEGKVRVVGDPLDLVKQMDGHIWRVVKEKSELEALEKEVDVISSRLYMGRLQVKMYAESQPVEGSESVAPEIEDLYFATINGLGVNGEKE